MRENLFNSAHKASNEKSRAGWDRTFKAVRFTEKDLGRKYKPEELVGIVECGAISLFTGAPHKCDKELDERIWKAIEERKERDMKAKEITKRTSESKGD